MFILIFSQALEDRGKLFSQRYFRLNMHLFYSMWMISVGVVHLAIQVVLRNLDVHQVFSLHLFL